MSLFWLSLWLSMRSVGRSSCSWTARIQVETKSQTSEWIVYINPHSYSLSQPTEYWKAHNCGLKDGTNQAVLSEGSSVYHI